jgi:hypothetical protein
MGITLTSVLRFIQMKTGYQRFRFISENEIIQNIKDCAIPDFTHYFPYKVYFPLHEDDLYDEDHYPGLFKIIPADAPISKIYGTGMVFSSSDLGLGGFPSNIGRNVFGNSIGAFMYGQMKANMYSIIQPQHITGEFIQPNFIQIYPKRRYFGHSTLVIELLLYHADDLHTIKNAYEQLFSKLCLLHTKQYIYELYKDLEDETVAGHQVRTKISSYADAGDKLDELYEKMEEESFKNPDRFDFPII